MHLHRYRLVKPEEAEVVKNRMLEIDDNGIWLACPIGNFVGLYIRNDAIRNRISNALLVGDHPLTLQTDSANRLLMRPHPDEHPLIWSPDSMNQSFPRLARLLENVTAKQTAAHLYMGKKHLHFEPNVIVFSTRAPNSDAYELAGTKRIKF